MRAQQLSAQNNIKVVYGAASLPADELVRTYLAGEPVTDENLFDH